VERRVSPPRRRAPPPPITPPQTAVVPPPVRQVPAAPMVTAGYRNTLARWFATHKRYPASARERGAEGQAVLRFRVDRSGRVIKFSIVRSTGHRDLDAAVEAMMRDAVLPPFPPDMAARDIEVSVAVRFRLAR
jgi:periplasmic protein TonB